MAGAFVLTLYDTKELFDLLDIELSEEEKTHIDLLHKTQQTREEPDLQTFKQKSLTEYFADIDLQDKKKRNALIINAYQDGHAQTQIGKYLGLSNVMVSKIVNQKLKVKA